MRRKMMTMAAIGALVAGLAGAPGEATSAFDTEPCTYPSGAPLPGTGDVRTVPDDYPTIQTAVNAAAEGDLIFIKDGVYREAVEVETPGLRIRGESREGVILDGEGTRQRGIRVRADRVMVENMTGRGYTVTAFYWTGVTGFWGRYLTAHNNGDYGIYAFDSRCGQFDSSYASAHPDAGFYIGQCFPCDAVIHDVVAEGNALGYSGTNAGGNLTLRDSVWRKNGLGIVPNSLDSQQNPPQRGTLIIRNLVEENNGRTTPGAGIAGTYWGGGIVLAGGQRNQVIGNTVSDHAFGGIVLSPLPDTRVWLAASNVIWGNTVTHDPVEHEGSIDLAQSATSGPNNCWERNTFTTSAPPLIEDIWHCEQSFQPPGGDPRVELALFEGAAGLNDRQQSDWRTYACEAGDVCPKTGLANAPAGPITVWLPALGH